MTTVSHEWLYCRFIKIQSNLRRKKLHRTNLGSNFLGNSFSNRDNVRAPIQFTRESQPQCYQTGQTKLAKFFQHWNQHVTSCHSPQCLIDQIQVQKSILVVRIRWLIIFRVESSTINIDSNITDNTSSGQSLMYSRKV